MSRDEDRWDWKGSEGSGILLDYEKEPDTKEYRIGTPDDAKALCDYLTQLEKDKEAAEARIADLEDEKEQLLLRKAQFRKASLLPPDVHDPERWLYLRSLKKADAIGQAFAMLEASILHHEIERDGWTPDDECYMETLGQARGLIETDRDRWEALVDEDAIEAQNALSIIGNVRRWINGELPSATKEGAIVDLQMAEGELSRWLARYDQIKGEYNG